MNQKRKQPSSIQQPALLHDLRLEEAVLGAIMLQSDILPQIPLQVEHFYDKNNKVIAEAILNLAAENKPIDLLTTIQEVRRMGNTDNLWFTYCADLTNRVTSAANTVIHFHLLHEFAMKRKYYEVCAEAMNTLATEHVDAFDVAEKMIEAIRKTASIDSIKIGVEPAETLERVMKRGEIKRLKLPPHLEQVFQFINYGNLIYLGGRPGMGKTTFLVDCIRHIAKLNGRVLFFSLEMSDEELMPWFMKNLANDYAGNEMNEYLSLPITVIKGEVTIESINRAVNLHLAKGEVCLVVVDTINRMKLPANDLRTGITILSAGLKTICNQYNIPAIVVAQLNRAIEDRVSADNIVLPELSDLRESGALEQDADQVLFIYRHSYYFNHIDYYQYLGETYENKNTVIFKQAKMRFADPSTTILHFDKSKELITTIADAKRRVSQPTLPVANTFNHSGNNFDKPTNPAEAPF